MSSDEVKQKLGGLVYVVWQKKKRGGQAGKKIWCKTVTEVLKGLKRRDPLLLCKIAVSEWECVTLRDRKKPYDIMIYYVKEKRETVHFSHLQY